jgi:hypothetical protein
MRQFIYSFSALLLLLAAFTASAHAQSGDAFSTYSPKMELPHLPPINEIDPAMLDEMDQVKENCDYGVDSDVFQNCHCYAIHFLAKRIQYPYLDAAYIHTQLTDVCLDPALIAGRNYSMCLSVYGQGRDLSTFGAKCACFGREVARQAQRMTRRLDYRTIIPLRNRAFSECNLLPD